jgi:Membrane bound FAD containing D-sorbitol dehydrogenase
LLNNHITFYKKTCSFFTAFAIYLSPPENLKLNLEGYSVMETEENLELFLSLSQVLTGENALDAALSKQYFERLAAVYPNELQTLLPQFAKLPGHDVPTEFKTIILNAATPEVIRLIKQIINVWFTASFFMPDDKTSMPPTTIEQYKGQLVYPLIKAPVRSYSDLDYGYWKNKPAGIKP